MRAGYLRAILGLGLLLIFSLAVWWIYDGRRKSRSPDLDKLVRSVRWEGPWYYRMARQTRTVRFIPDQWVNWDKLESDIGQRRWLGVSGLSKLGTNGWPVVPDLVSIVAHKSIYLGLEAAEALVGVKADECLEWDRVRKVLKGRTQAASTFRYLVVGRDRFGRTFDLAHRRFGLVGLAATGPAAGIAYSDVLDVFKHDQDPELRACAVMVLGGLKPEGKEARVWLKGVLLDKEEWPAVSAAAAQALVTAAPQEAETRELLRQALQDPRSAVRLAAVTGLWRIKAPSEEVLPVLTALLTHKLASTRVGALKALAEMRSAAQPCAPEVQRLTSDENESVRRAAVEALRSIHGGA
jgi:HEAT repeat protein